MSIDLDPFNINLNIRIHDPIELLNIRKQNKEEKTSYEQRVIDFNGWGIYFLSEGKIPMNEFTPIHEKIIYIGKASSKKSNILSRCSIHFGSFTGNKNMRPGSNMAAYIAERNKEMVPDGMTAAHGIFAYPANIITENQIVNLRNKKFLISCCEEYYIQCFIDKHGNLPKANTHN